MNKLSKSFIPGAIEAKLSCKLLYISKFSCEIIGAKEISLTLFLNNLDTYNDALDTYNDIKEIYGETSKNVITLFTTSFEDKVLIDSDTLNYIVTLLENIYANNIALLFIMSCLGSVYICTYRRKKDYIMINNVEPKLLKGEIIEKV